MEKNNRHEEVLTVKVRKVFYDQDPSHWEVEMTDHQGNYAGGLSAFDFDTAWSESFKRIIGAPDDVGFIEPTPNPWVTLRT
jgi:hypothetical protein